MRGKESMSIRSTDIRLMRFPNVIDMPSYDYDFIDDVEGLVSRISKIFSEPRPLTREDRSQAFNLMNQLNEILPISIYVQRMENDNYLHLAQDVLEQKAEEKYKKYSTFAFAYINAFNEVSEMMKKSVIGFEYLEEKLINLFKSHDSLYFELLKNGLLI